MKKLMYLISCMLLFCLIPLQAAEDTTFTFTDFNAVNAFAYAGSDKGDEGGNSSSVVSNDTIEINKALKWEWLLDDGALGYSYSYFNLYIGANQTAPNMNISAYNKLTVKVKAEAAAIGQLMTIQLKSTDAPRNNIVTKALTEGWNNIEVEISRDSLNMLAFVFSAGDGIVGPGALYFDDIELSNSETKSKFIFANFNNENTYAFAGSDKEDEGGNSSSVVSFDTIEINKAVKWEWLLDDGDLGYSYSYFTVYTGAAETAANMDISMFNTLTLKVKAEGAAVGQMMEIHLKSTDAPRKNIKTKALTEGWNDIEVTIERDSLNMLAFVFSAGDGIVGPAIVHIDDIKLMYVEPVAEVVAAFDANIVSGNAPLTVQFTDGSTEGTISWFWDFGDGQTSASQSPNHTYETAGTYSVTLIAGNGTSFDTLTKVDFINVELVNSVSEVSFNTGLEVYPNPMTTEATIEFNLKIKGLTTMKVFDIAGKQIETILNSELKSGKHSVKWNASKLSKGLYVLRITTSGVSESIKINLK